MFFQIFIAIGLLVAVIAYLWIFRAEGIFAFYLLGMSLIYVVVGMLKIPWSTEATGAIFPILFFPCVLWWWWAKDDPNEPRLPRQFGTSAVLILFLALLWQVKHLFETHILRPQSVYEYYKWMYMIARWIAPFILGLFFPLTLKRLRRFLAAASLLALILAGVTVLSFIIGRETAATEARYTPAERLGGLGVGIFGGLGGACLMGYMLLVRQTGGKKVPDFLCWSSLAVIAMAILASGSRGPVISMGLTLVVMLLLFGGRNAFRAAVGLGVVGILLFLCWNLLPQAALARIFGEGAVAGEEGAGLRWRLFVASFNILKEAPFFGQTIELASIIRIADIDTSHQVITQVMMELGLFGLILFLIAFIPPVIQWPLIAFKRTLPIHPFVSTIALLLIYEVIQRHIAGQLANHDFWIIMGLVMGHKLTLAGGEEKITCIEDFVETHPSFNFEPTWRYIT